MRRAMVCSSSRAEGSSASLMCASIPSSSRRRSTARPRRMLSAAMIVPIAVSRNTGATTSWITAEISGTCGSKVIWCLLFLQQVAAFLQRVLELGLGNQHGVRRGRETDVIVLALQLADLDRVRNAVERGGVDQGRVLEAGVLRILGGDIGELEQAERVGGRVGAPDVELLPGPGAGQLPPGIVGRALDAPAAAVGVAQLEALELFDLEGAAIEPVGAPGAGLPERVGDDEHRLRVGGQHHEAAVGARLLRVFDLAPEVLLADHQPGQRLAVRGVELDLRAGLVQVEACAVRIADRLALPDLQAERLQHEPAHLAEVRRKTVALGDHPALLLALQRERCLRLDDADRGDLGDLQVLQQGLAERAGVRRRTRALLLVVEQRTAADDRQQHHQDGRDAGVHAFLLLRAAISRPAAATKRGISAMLATLVQNTRLSASWRRFLRTSFSASRVSATVLRKRSSSACCSGLRICADLPAGPPCVFRRSCSLAVVFCSSSSSAWILPKYCFCASASSSRTTVSGRKAPVRLRSDMRSSPAANCSTMPMTKARLPLEGTTTLRPNTSWMSTAAPSASMSTSATRITEFSLPDSRSAGVFGTGLALSCFPSSLMPSGKAVLNLPVRRSASGIAFPSGLKLFVASSPDLVALALSTSIELGELFTNSVTFRSFVLTSNAPP